MAEQSEQSTKWYENTAEGTFHEVLEGSDNEKRMKREMRQVGDDPEDLEPAYRPVAKSSLPAASNQPGYVKSDGTPASPVDPQAGTQPQTPTADTNRGPLVGEPGAEDQAEREVELGGAAPGGVEPQVTAQAAAPAATTADEKPSASSRSAKK